MRRASLTIAVFAAIAAAYILGQHHPSSSSTGNGGRRILYYVDPMHPAYRSDKPGIAPDCGMALQAVFADGPGPGNGAPASNSAIAPALSDGAVSIDASTRKLLGIRLASVERGGATRVIRAVGRIAPEDTRIYRVNSGVDGFVRETHGDAIGTLVKKDQKLAAYYAPDFVTAASGFLAANERVPGSVAKEGARSIQNYTDRLRNLGMSDVQIKRMAESRQLPEDIDVVAPADGFILARAITPGQHFMRDIEFYRIADLSQVWVSAEVFEQEASYLRPGGIAQIAVRGLGRRLSARITDSLPQSETGGGTVKLRLEAANPGFILRPDMLVDVELPVRLPPALTVPVDALVDSGTRARVYVETGETGQGQDVFEPREVEPGRRFGERVEILHGLQPGEQVVASATFLVDSESRLKTPVSQPPAPHLANSAAEPAPHPPVMKTEGTKIIPAKMSTAKAVKDPSCGMMIDPALATKDGNTQTYRGVTYYFCSKQCKQTFLNDPARVSGGITSGTQGSNDD